MKRAQDNDLIQKGIGFLFIEKEYGNGDNRFNRKGILTFTVDYCLFCGKKVGTL